MKTKNIPNAYLIILEIYPLSIKLISLSDFKLKSVISLA